MGKGPCTTMPCLLYASSTRWQWVGSCQVNCCRVNHKECCCVRDPSLTDRAAQLCIDCRLALVCELQLYLCANMLNKPHFSRQARRDMLSPTGVCKKKKKKVCYRVNKRHTSRRTPGVKEGTDGGSGPSQDHRGSRGTVLCRTIEGVDHKPKLRASHVKGSQGLTTTARKRGRCQERPHT